MHNLDRVGHVQPAQDIETDAAIEVSNLQQLEQEEAANRAAYIADNGIHIINSRSQIRPDYERITEAYMTPSYLAKIGNTFIHSHRIEQFAATALVSQGIYARALEPIVDGNTNNKKGDIIITLPCTDTLAAIGCKPLRRQEEDEPIMQVALEVKEARGANALLGLPLEDDDRYAIAGFDRYPKFLWVDSVRSWNEKHKWHERRNIPLVGAVVAAPIGELSDEEITTLGLLFLPSPAYSDVWLPDVRKPAPWTKATCTNPYKQTTYTAYKAKGTSNILPLRALADQLMSETQAG